MFRTARRSVLQHAGIVSALTVFRTTGVFIYVFFLLSAVVKSVDVSSSCKATKYPHDVLAAYVKQQFL